MTLVPLLNAMQRRGFKPSMIRDEDAMSWWSFPLCVPSFPPPLKMKNLCGRCATLLNVHTSSSLHYDSPPPPQRPRMGIKGTDMKIRCRPGSRAVMTRQAARSQCQGTENMANGIKQPPGSLEYNQLHSSVEKTRNWCAFLRSLIFARPPQ